MEPTCHAGGNVKWYHHFGKPLAISNKSKACDSAIPLLSVSLREMKTYVHTEVSAPAFRVALYVTALKQRQKTITGWLDQHSVRPHTRTLLRNQKEHAIDL